MRFCAAPVIWLKRSLGHSYKFSRLKKRVRLAFGKTVCQESSTDPAALTTPIYGSYFLKRLFGNDKACSFRLCRRRQPDPSSTRGVLFYNSSFLASRRPSMLVSARLLIYLVSH